MKTPVIYTAMAVAVAIAALVSADNVALILSGVIIGLLGKDAAGGGPRQLNP